MSDNNEQEYIIEPLRPFAVPVKGPYHITNGDGDLLAGEQYYTEEFNGTIAPVPGKGAYVRLTS
jgi:hypothetical protein